MVVDHIEQVIPVHTSFEELGVENTIDRIWCEASNLQAACPDCHDKKTAEEKLHKKTYQDSLKPSKTVRKKKAH